MTTVAEVDPSHIDCEANLFQSAFWARFKKMRGYDTQAFVIEHRGRRSPLVMVHRPCASDAVFGYVPHGPDIAIEEDRQGRLRGSWDYPFDEKRYPLLALSGVDPRLAGAKSGPGPKAPA